MKQAKDGVRERREPVKERVEIGRWRDTQGMIAHNGGGEASIRH